MSTSSVALVSVVVTVTLFCASQVLLLRTARRSARTALVSDVLTALEQVARTHARPVFVRIWTKPELEYALLVPRLLVGLRQKDRIIAVWARTRVDAMLAAKTQADVVVIASDLSGKISEWHLGQRQRAWFAQEVDDYRPLRNRTTRRTFHTSAQATGLVVLTIICATVPGALGAALAARWSPD